MKKTTFERIWCRPDDLPYLLTILFETNDIDRVEVEPASSGITYIVTAYREEE